MEVAGLVASLVSLTKEVTAATDSLIRHFRTAPKELVQLHNQVSLLHLQLACIAQFEGQGTSNALLPVQDVQVLGHAIQIAKNDIIAIRKELEDHAKRNVGKPSASARLSWALFDRKSVEDALAQLERVESRLLLLLQFINLRTSIDSRKENLDLGAQILQELRTLQTRIDTQQGIATANILSAAKEVAIESTVAFRHKHTLEVSNHWKNLLGLDFALTRSQNDYQIAYALHTRLPFWFPTGQMAFMTSLSVRRAWGFWPNISILGGGLNFVNVIPVESEIVKACKKGDLLAVQTLFLEKKAAPNDMAGGKTLLYFAIESGSFKVIKFLIEAGAPVQSRQFLRTAWYRQSDMARLFLRTKSVELEAIHPDGDTVAFFLYGPSRPREQQVEYLEMLASYSFSQFNAQDKDGWTVLHRAAAWGSAADIKALIRLGAIQDLRTRRLSWTPLICAVAYRNFDTLQALWDCNNDTKICEQKDLREWNLLHIAVGYNHFDAIPYLIHKGVYLGSVSTPTSLRVPLLLKEKSVTPGEIARAFGETAYRRWTAALGLAGHTADVRPEDIDWTSEDTNELFGECECCNNWRS